MDAEVEENSGAFALLLPAKLFSHGLFSVWCAGDLFDVSVQKRTHQSLYGRIHCTAIAKSGRGLGCLWIFADFVLQRAEREWQQDVFLFVLSGTSDAFGGGKALYYQHSFGVYHENHADLNKKFDKSLSFN